MAVGGKEQFFKYNTLAILLCGVEGRRVTVEMKNESYANGILESVDGYMNLSLRKATLTTSKGARTRVDLVRIRSSSVRNVLLPDDVNPVTVIKQQLGLSNSRRNKTCHE